VQLEAIVFGHAFKERFQEHGFRAVVQVFQDGFQLHPGPSQLALVISAVISVPGKSVQFMHNQDVESKSPFFAS
jgi:hypothetical protein